MKAYYYAGEGDQRLPHEGTTLPPSHLSSLGIHTWQNASAEDVDTIAATRHYKNRDTITVSRAAFGASYDSKVRSFFAEHLHEDEEIRYILDGEGYFDVRDKADAWIRIAMEKGDVAVLPAGIWHRFTTSQTDYIKAMRLFKDEPAWVPLNRSQEIETSNPFRQEYVKSISTDE